MKESDFSPAETVTVVISESGWIRMAKGEIDATQLNYRAGDGYLDATVGKSNQRVYLLDQTGRSYALAANNLPSARGQGEPLTSKLNPASGVQFIQVLMGEDEQQIISLSSQGYGFKTQLKQLDTSAKAGKSFLTIADGSVALPIALNTQKAQLAMLSKLGRLLIIDQEHIPELNKGKGNKLMQLEAEDELISHIALNVEEDILKIQVGTRFLSLKGDDLKTYYGKKATKGKSLPRGYQKAQRLLLDI